MCYAKYLWCIEDVVYGERVLLRCAALAWSPSAASATSSGLCALARDASVNRGRDRYFA